MTYIPTENDKIAQAFKHVPEKGVPEWRIFSAVRGDRVSMYSSKARQTTSDSDASREMHDELREDVYQ